MSLELCHLTFCLKHNTLLENISLTLEEGKLFGVLGPNGSGKSTLLKTISRIWEPTSGQIFWRGQDMQNFSRHALSQTVSLVPQNPHPFFDFAIHQMVAMGRYTHGCRTPEALEKIENALRQVDIWNLRHRMLSELSGGERQRVYIARALVTEAPILLLDEPTAHLDLRHQLSIWELLKVLVQSGKLVIVAVHDLWAAQRYCDKIALLNGGRCQVSGEYEKAVTPQILQDTFGVYLNPQGQFELT